MASPSVTENSAANALASGSLAAGANTTFDINATSKFGVQVQVKDTGGGTVASTNGLQVDVYRMFTGVSGVVDTESILTFVIPTVVSTTKYKSFELPTGRYRIKLTNLDASNGITVQATTITVDSIA